MRYTISIPTKVIKVERISFEYNFLIDMITVEEVDKLIAENLLSTDIISVPLSKCLGRVLAEDIFADRDFPPFNRVMMDGIAIRYTDWNAGIREFKVQGLQPAGAPSTTLEESGSCIEVMTGAVCPTQSDTVIKYEDVTIENARLPDGQDRAIVDADHEIKAKQHVHPQGSDRVLNDLLIPKGGIITASEIGVLATVGKETVQVSKRLKIAIVATGDELVEVNETPLPQQIRKSNVYTLQAALKDKGFRSDIFHIVDSKEKLREDLKAILNDHEIVILSGGVSKGKLDFVPEILTELGVEKAFHFVKQRPGKPFWFGTYSNGVVFALPGNPTSSFVGLNRYVIPFLFRSEGTEPHNLKARLTEDFSFKPDLTYFLQVKLEYDNEGHLLATPHKGNGSGDLTNLVEADGLLEIPMGKTDFKKGEVFECMVYRG